jgi:hypothetical protein
LFLHSSFTLSHCWLDNRQWLNIIIIRIIIYLVFQKSTRLDKATNNKQILQLSSELRIEFWDMMQSLQLHTPDSHIQSIIINIQQCTVNTAVQNHYLSVAVSLDNAVHTMLTTLCKLQLLRHVHHAWQHISCQWSQTQNLAADILCAYLVSCLKTKLLYK